MDKVSDRHFLAAYRIAPVDPFTNSFYALVDLEKLDFISDIRIGDYKDV